MHRRGGRCTTRTRGMARQGRRTSAERGRGWPAHAVLVAVACLLVTTATLAWAAPRYTSRHRGSHTQTAHTAAAAAELQSLANLPGPAAAAAAASSPSLYRPGEVLLAFRNGVSASRQRAIESALGARSPRRLGP